MKIRILYILFLILGTANNVFAQPENAVIEKIDGKKYYMHNVEPGETLYGISKMYNVPIPAILNANPEIKNGLKIDELIKLPVSAQEKPQKESAFIQDRVEKGILYHKVQPKETLYGISKKFEVSIADIQSANENFAGLKEGEIIKIPVGKKYEQPTSKPKKEEKKEKQTIEEVLDKAKTVKDSLDNMSIQNIEDEFAEEVDTLVVEPKKKDGYNIALMLPFYLAENDTINKNTKAAEKPYIYKKSEIALSIYRGVKFAFDSLKKLGFEGDLYVYDTNNDVNVIDSLLQLTEMKQMDLFIGPLYRSSFQKVSEFAKANNQLIVSPVPQSNKILLGNEHVFKVSPSNPIHISKIIDEVVEKYFDAHVLVLNNFEGKGIKMVDQVLKEGNRKLFANTYDSISVDSIQELYLETVTTKKIAPHLSSEKQNIIIIPSNDQSFVSDFLVQLNNTDTIYEKVVFGLEKWQHWDNIDVDYLHDLNVHITSSIYSNYQSDSYVSFENAYKKKYFITPSKYDCIGFATGNYFFNQFQKNGVNFYKSEDNMTSDSESCNFHFFKTSLESGYENGFVYLLKYENYELKEVK